MKWSMIIVKVPPLSTPEQLYFVTVISKLLPVKVHQFSAVFVPEVHMPFSVYWSKPYATCTPPDQG
jgi:hypothetical protein